MKDNGFYGVDIRVPRRIKQYGEVDEFEQAPAPQAYEPPPEVQVRYRNFKILTITAMVLLFMLLAQSMILVAVRLLFQQELYVKMIALAMEVILVVAGIAVFVAYQYIYHSLSYVNMGAIIITELMLLVGQLVVSNYTVPTLYYCLIALSAGFVLYALIFLKIGVKFRLAFSVVPVFVLLITNLIYLKSIEFTPRYIYLSTNGYSNSVSDKDVFYYKNALNTEYDGVNSFEDVILITETMSNTVSGIHSVTETEIRADSLEYLNETYMPKLPMGDVVNFDGKYDDEFFKNYSLYFSVLELENPDDTVECVELQYSFAYARPVLKYKRSNTKIKAENQRAACIMVFELPVETEKAIIDELAGFTTDRAIIKYH